MKTTLEVPDELVRELKIRAAIENRRLKDVVAEVIRRGLGQDAPSDVVRHTVALPLVHCAHAALPSQEMTPDRVASVLAADEAEMIAAPK